MLPTTLSSSLKNLAVDLQIPDINKLTIFFESYHKNSRLKYVYVGALMRSLSIDSESAYILLNRLVTDGFLRKLYEFRCPNDANKKHFSEDYINLPTNVTCDECFDDFNLREHLFIVYEVTNNV